MDNFRVYDASMEFMSLTPADVTALSSSKMAYLRTHSTQRTYTMDMLTNPAAVVGKNNLDPLSPQTLPWLFNVMRQTGEGEDRKGEIL